MNLKKSFSASNHGLSQKHNQAIRAKLTDEQIIANHHRDIALRQTEGINNGVKRVLAQQIPHIPEILEMARGQQETGNLLKKLEEELLKAGRTKTSNEIRVLTLIGERRARTEKTAAQLFRSAQVISNGSKFEIGYDPIEIING